MPMTPLDFEVIMGPSGFPGLDSALRVGKWSESLASRGIDKSFSLETVWSSCEDDSAERVILAGWKRDVEKDR